MIIKGEPGGRARLEWELHKSDTRCTLLSHLAIKCWNFEVDTEKTHLTGLNINRELLEETRRPLSARLEIAVYTQVCCWDERACLAAFDCSLPCCIPHLHFLVTSQFVCLYLVTHTLLSDFPFFFIYQLKALHTEHMQLSSQFRNFNPTFILSSAENEPLTWQKERRSRPVAFK